MKALETDENDKQFSVVQFSADGTYKYVTRWVSLLHATKVLRQCSKDFASQIGATTRLIIVDGLDCIAVEWVQGKGITYPTKEMLEDVK